MVRPSPTLAEDPGLGFYELGDWAFFLDA